ncbi:hypothetical protein [Thermofilum sp.]|jgi:hypothetical protein|uniref:hypothetical protein n=1 Tax=Thermofilum sp. TaxID=1961369 RepID=UPI0025838798|nr:hypothetical protein [Thermofilum sp.]
MSVAASKTENREELALAYQRLKLMGQAYLSTHEKSSAESPTPEQSPVTARLAVSIFLAGLPETSIVNFKPVQEGDLFGVQVRKPKGIVHIHYLTWDELDTISALLDQFMAVKPGEKASSIRSKVRTLQYACHNFRKEVGILSLTYRDVYALKAAVLGLQVPYYYSRRDYESTLLIVNEAYRKMRSRGLV